MSPLSDEVSPEPNSQQGAVSVFRDLPSLNKAFCRDATDWSCNRRRIVICNGCQRQLNTNELNRMLKHASKCSGLIQEVREEMSTNLMQRIVAKNSHSDDADIILLKFIIKNNLSFSVTECKYLQSLIEKTRKLQSDYKLPTRRDLIETQLIRLHKSIKEQFNVAISSSPDNSLSIEFDMWEDARSRSLLALVITFSDGSHHLHALEDLSAIRHTGVNLKATIESMISNLPHEKINSLVSDSASNCRNARELINTENRYKHIIQHRCMAHNLNRMGNMIANNEHFVEHICWATELRTTIHSNKILCAKLVDAGMNKIPKPTDVRWYSHIDMLETINRFRDLIISIADPDESPEAHDSIRRLRDDRFMDGLKMRISILRPLCNCIATAEREDVSLAECFSKILEFAKSVLEADWSIGYVLAAVEAYIEYFGPTKLGNEFGLLLTAYYLDPRYQACYVTSAGKLLVLKYLAELAKKSRVGARTIEDVLPEEFSNYCYRRNEFGGEITAECNGKAYWQTARRKKTALGNLATRLLNIHPSSANIERCFSGLKNIQSMKRTKLDLDNLFRVAQIRMSMHNNRDCNFDDNDAQDWTHQESKRTRADALTTEVMGLSWSSQDTISLSSHNLETSFNSSIPSIDSQIDMEVSESPRQRPRIYQDLTQLTTDKLMSEWNRMKEFIDFSFCEDFSIYANQIEDQEPEIDLETISRRFTANMARQSQLAIERALNRTSINPIISQTK